MAEEIEKIQAETSKPTKDFYAFSYKSIFCTDKSPNGIIKHREFVSTLKDMDFQNELKKLEPEKIADRLEFHLRFFTRSGGTKVEWIAHTKTLLPPNLTPEQMDAFLTWIENNEKQENEKEWNLRNLAAIRNHTDQVLQDIAFNKGKETTRTIIENEILQDKEQNIPEWKSLIKHEVHGLLELVEIKIKNEISSWKARKNLIQCAAFCQLLFDRKYFVSKSTNRKSVNSFALSRYGTDITIQLKSAKKNERESHKVLLKKHFK